MLHRFCLHADTPNWHDQDVHLSGSPWIVPHAMDSRTFHVIVFCKLQAVLPVWEGNLQKRSEAMSG